MFCEPRLSDADLRLLALPLSCSSKVVDNQLIAAAGIVSGAAGKASLNTVNSEVRGNMVRHGLCMVALPATACEAVHGACGLPSFQALLGHVPRKICAPVLHRLPAQAVSPSAARLAPRPPVREAVWPATLWQQQA